MNGIAVYFSDYFGVNIDDIDEYGAINISLINDLPLFIDPFLLFNSEKEEYQEIHKEMIKYLQFLQVQSQLTNTLSAGMRQAWFKFPEVKQTWLGFSQSGNAGRGMGKTFANGMFKGLTSIFKDFSNLEITKSPHMEKLCLISPNVGRDKISDFTTNFAKKYLLEYTEKFAKKYIGENNCRIVTVNRVAFNWNTYMWQSGTYYLPYYNEDYVLLTPKDMLTRDGQYELYRQESSIGKKSNNFLDLEVLDNYTGHRRPVGSLSGGESFKASLSLALGLSDTVSSNLGGIQMDALFVDEGFGTLDHKSMDSAMDALVNLSGNNKLVGIISHREELVESIPQQIKVKKSKEGSQITVEAGF